MLAEPVAGVTHPCEHVKLFAVDVGKSVHPSPFVSEHITRYLSFMHIACPAVHAFVQATLFEGHPSTPGGVTEQSAGVPPMTGAVVGGNEQQLLSPHPDAPNSFENPKHA
jgi:hypothetical protein